MTERLTKEDVFNTDRFIVADDRHGGYDEKNLQSRGRCPIFGDFVDLKSVTVVCTKEEAWEVETQLTYQHGANSVSQYKELDDGRVAMRSDYMAW